MFDVPFFVEMDLLKTQFWRILLSNLLNPIMGVNDEDDESSVPLDPFAIVRTADSVIWFVDADTAEGFDMKKGAEEWPLSQTNLNS